MRRRESFLETSQKQGPVAEAGELVEQPVFAVGLGAQNLRVDAGVHHRHIHGFDHVIVGALVERVDDRIAIVDSAHHDRRKLTGRICGAQQTQQVESTHTRHHVVQQDQIIVGLMNLGQCLRAVFGDFDLVTEMDETAREQISIFEVIVDDQQLAWIRCHSASLR